MPKYVLQELPEEFTEGKRVVYPKMRTYTLHDYDTVLEHMRVYAANLSDGVMRAVLDALTSTMASWMPQGHNIKVDGLGVFSLVLGFDETSPKEQLVAEADGVSPMEQQSVVGAGDELSDADFQAGYRHVCIKGIKFKPDPNLIAAMNRGAEFVRDTGEIKVQQKTKLSLEERMARALALIDKNGRMTLTDYALATGQERSVASRDLKRIVAAGDSPIVAEGAHSHKVWVRRK